VHGFSPSEVVFFQGESSDPRARVLPVGGRVLRPAFRHVRRRGGP
jgi:hypothetical protein